MSGDTFDMTRLDEKIPEGVSFVRLPVAQFISLLNFAQQSIKLGEPIRYAPDGVHQEPTSEG